MSFKLIAIGNVLMKDDAIGIKVAEEIEEELLKLGVNVVYGETSLQHCISSVEEEDYIIILDSAYYGKSVGEITIEDIDKYISKKVEASQHIYSFLDLLKLYYPNIKGIILGIEVEEIDFGIGLSSTLKKNLKLISNKVLKIVEKINNERKVLHYLINIDGIVQGVGFRPFVYRKAKKYNISGYVKNLGGSVEIYCEGIKSNLKEFILSILNDVPPISKVEKFRCKFIRDNTIYKSNLDTNSFVIKESINEKAFPKFVSPDISICENCLSDMKENKSNRYKYAFTNCTDCGPRYSIIKSLPYDRHYTTMKKFTMCKECNDEYNNPLSRRFHAEPNCCDKCGPGLWLTDNKGEKYIYKNPIDEAKRLLKEGKILAIKGIGGFHLVCDGRNEKAINILRKKKLRSHKPLAVMVRDINVVKEICEVSSKEEIVLKSNKRPIVILKKKSPFLLPEAIAPKQNSLGVMLPYTGLHYLLLEEDLDFLIMTSGNISNMPMEYKNQEALNNLKDVADYFLFHDRDIYIEEDDSVVKVIDSSEKVIRRGRGYSPYISKSNNKYEIIAIGGDQKSSVCVSKNGYIYLSQYLGSLEDFNSYNNFKYVLNHFINLFDIDRKLLVHDMHPSYLSTKYAKEQNINKIEVQHHHAHMVSCMAEHSIYENVIGVIFDGTGFGLDGAIWGGEFFVGNRKSFKRAGHLEYINIQGGNKAIEEPCRCAVSYLYFLGYNPAEILKNIEKEKIEVVIQALKSKVNCFLSSSIGRLFDAVASITGLRNYITYDGQGAIELENIIDKNINESYMYDIDEIDGVFQIKYKKIIEGILMDRKQKEPISKISAKFHNSLVYSTCDLVCILGKKERLRKVVLSGGVFENEYLLKLLYKNLTKKGFQVFYNKEIPTNDGGLSFGQLNIASEILSEN